MRLFLKTQSVLVYYIRTRSIIENNRMSTVSFSQLRNYEISFAFDDKRTPPRSPFGERYLPTCQGS